MNCEGCGEQDGSINWRDPEDPRGEGLWLCPECADRRDEQALGEGPQRPAGAPVASLLAADLDQPGPETCPACGWTAGRFRRTHRLGCARCYSVFRAVLAPILGRYHRHVSHLGKTPGREGAEPSRLAEITRNRVALEKAIAREDFEAAAALRDRIQQLESHPADPEAAS